jgi:DNA-binding NarL/FixJ family response regulator
MDCKSRFQTKELCLVKGDSASTADAVVSQSLPSQPSLSDDSDIDSIFRHHPDLFRDSSQLSGHWDNVFHSASPSGIRTLLVRSKQSQEPLRESILADRRLDFCGLAERLGDACRQIRQQTFQVVVFSMSGQTQDMLPLLELMNGASPRAKAIAVLDRQASSSLQQMIHPKVLGYVATQDISSHLADAVVEVSQGRFTASPSMSMIVMRLMSHYLRSQDTMPPVSKAKPLQPTLSSDNEYVDVHSEKYPSNLHFSQSAPQSHFGHTSSGAHHLLSEREIQILQLVAGGLSSNDIALQLTISVPTVNTHVRNIFGKLNVRTRAQAIHVGIAHGLILVN